MKDPEPAVGWTEALGAAADNPPNPTASGWVLHHRDKKTGAEDKYVVPALANRHRAQFEMWVRGEALKSIAEVANEDEADAMRSVYQSDFANGHYKWDDNFDGKKIKSARKSVYGAIQLLYILMRSARPNLTEERAFEVFVADSAAAIEAYRWAMGNWRPPLVEQADGGGGKPAAREEVKLTPEEMAEVLAKRATSAERAPPKTMDQQVSA